MTPKVCFHFGNFPCKRNVSTVYILQEGFSVCAQPTKNGALKSQLVLEHSDQDSFIHHQRRGGGQNFYPFCHRIPKMRKKTISSSLQAVQILSDVMSALITSQIKENNFIYAESVQWCESSVHLVCFIPVCTSVHPVCFILVCTSVPMY